MKKMLDRFIDKSGFWLSYWPIVISFFLNASVMVMNLNWPSKYEWLQNFAVLCGAVGITMNIKSVYSIWKLKRKVAKEHAKFHSFMLSLKPHIEAILNEEMNVEGRAEEESLSVAHQKIQTFINEEMERHKILAEQSKTDKT